MSNPHVISSTPDISSHPLAFLKSRWLWGLCLLLLLVAGGSSFWYWKHWARPGMSHYLKGADYAALKQYDKAEQEWKLGMQKDPSFVLCYESLGDLYAALRAYAEAASHYKIATKLSPNDGSLFLRLARVEQAREQYPDALSAAKRAAELLPNDADAQGQYGILSAKRKDRATAIMALRKAHALAPDSADYMLALANSELDTLDLPGAERDLTAFLSRHPDNTDANFLMAVIYNQKPRTPDNLKTAISYAERALPKMRGDKRISIVLGQLYLDAGRVKDALRIYQEGIQVNSDLPQLYHGLVNCYARLGDKVNQQKAIRELQVRTTRSDRIQHLRHVLGFNWRKVDAGLELARLYEANGDYSYAVGAYGVLLERFPRDARVLKAQQAFNNRVKLLKLQHQKAHKHNTLQTSNQKPQAAQSVPASQP